MKYIIKESKLDLLMSQYLDSWFENRQVMSTHDLIFVGDVDAEGYDFFELEYNGDDGGLIIRDGGIIKFLSDLFGKTQEEAQAFFVKYFENRFNVEVNYVD
jgi:hypothetical protein